jgi:hypothetical protein
MTTRGIATLATVALALAACGSSAAETHESSDALPEQRAPAIPAAQLGTIQALLGPWQAVPLRLDAGFRARAIATCARDMDAKPGMQFTTIDARGEGVAIVRLQGIGHALCNALQIEPSGELTGAGSGESSTTDNPPVLGEFEVADVALSSVEGGALEVQGWSVQGRVGPGIRFVTVQAAGAPIMLATVENGWFAAWWPANLPPEPREAPGQLPHFLVRGYDAGQVERAEYQQ